MLEIPAINFELQSYSHAVLSNELSALTKIYQSDVNICIVSREMSVSVDAFIAQLLAVEQDLNLTQIISIATWEVSTLLPPYLHFEGYDNFCSDISHLIDVFSHLFELENVGLRLSILDKAMCPKFHVDHVPCRLISTYGGIGTQWLEDVFVNRRKLGSGSDGLSDEVSGLIVADLEVISTMPTYAIGLFKGSQWEGNELHGAVHRSPKLPDNAPRRLLLTLDFA
jgi:hypothetical protein